MGKVHKRIRYFERIDIYGPEEDNEKWLTWCWQKGYRVIRSGPKRISVGKYDMGRFHFIAEREIIIEDEG